MDICELQKRPCIPLRAAANTGQQIIGSLLGIRQEKDSFALESIKPGRESRVRRMHFADRVLQQMESVIARFSIRGSPLVT